MARILIIDDNDEFRKLFRMMLEKFGYEVAEASDGEEGVELYREKPADLVITDLIMPGKEGVQTCVELRSNFPDVKIIAMSGGGFEGPEDYLESAELIGGALRTFAKPFSFKEILKAIKEILEEK
ncbi:MAG: response regulator [Candidatus Omnitrophota bacterium]|nr:response regulator [Candidatus Omnitrophota bacterium]